MTFKSSAVRMIATLFICATLLFTTIGFSATNAYASGSKTITRYAPTTAAAKIVSSDGSISSVTIKNIGSVTVYLGNSSSVTASAAASTDGDPLLVNNVVEYDNISDAVYAITASGTGEIRVTVVKGGGSIRNGRMSTTGISNGSAANTIPMSDGTNLVASNALFYNLSTAITPNSTTTATASGTYAMTSNATGLGVLFRSDGSKWQLLPTYSDMTTSSTSVTTATTSTSDVYLQAPCAGNLTGIDFTSIDALSASDTNYITWTLVNLGQSGVGTTAMLAVSDLNTTKATGGVAITAVARHALTVHGTAGNLVVAKGDVLRLRATVTGTLAGAVTGSRAIAYFTRLS